MRRRRTGRAAGSEPYAGPPSGRERRGSDGGREEKEGDELEPREVARLAAEAAADKKARDVVALDVGDLLVVTDYFVLATGATDRQVRTIAEEVEKRLKERAGVRAIGREGEREARWVLLDFVDVVVHVFQPGERDFYRLDRLWSDAPRLELPAEVTNASGEGAAAEGAAEGGAGEQPPS
ncbi:MAG: ribosome silencing factor [Coriobacteriia bacterium]|nr:ribosome silencing factor [Coriobacteriia bacterium]